MTSAVFFYVNVKFSHLVSVKYSWRTHLPKSANRSRVSNKSH